MHHGRLYYANRNASRVFVILIFLMMAPTLFLLYRYILMRGGTTTNDDRFGDDANVITWKEGNSYDAEESILRYYPQGATPDAVIVLCGGSHLPPWSVLRFDAAIRVQRLFGEASGGVPIVVSGGGSPHVEPWVVQEGSAPHVVHESTEGCEYIRSRGYTGTLMKEVSSYDTIGNAYFMRTLFMDPGLWTNVIVITSRWHMPRSKLLFHYINGLQGVGGRLGGGGYTMPKMVFVGTDDGAFGDSLQLRLTSERKSVEVLRTKVLPKTNELGEFHFWLNTKHQQYDEFGPKERETKRTAAQNSLY
eukprot:PhF_6_TR8452/c0_g1_i1/m.13181